MAGETETTSALPESATVEEAAALMSGLSEDEGGPAAQARTANATAEGGDTPAVGLGSDEDDAAEGEAAEGDGEAGPEGDGEEDGEAQETTDAEGAPAFWSAEDKAAWEKIPVELRPTLRKYEQQRVEFVNQKAREAAQVREQAQAEVHKAAATIDEAAKWWSQAGPALNQAFADKWSQVNWSELAEKNPAEWARLNQIRTDEGALLAEANRRGQADLQAVQQRQMLAFQEAKRSEHAKVAGELPAFFGTPEKATDTYKALGDYLFSQGIPADRINQIHEAPIIKLALKAWRFDQAQKKASTVTNPGAANSTAKLLGYQQRATPTRVAPGPASSAPSKARAGNRQSDAARQVGERFRKTGGTSIADAAELIRLNGL